MAESNPMRTLSTVPVPAVRHLSRRSTAPRTGPVVATLMLSSACALLIGGAAASAAAPAPHVAAHLLAATPTPSPTLQPLPVVVAPPSEPAQVAPPGIGIAPPAPRPAPTPPPGAVQGIQAPAPVDLPPVAVLPSPSQTSGAGRPMLPLGLLAALVATLLLATGLTARRIL